MPLRIIIASFACLIGFFEGLLGDRLAAISIFCMGILLLRIMDTYDLWKKEKRRKN